RRRWLRRTLGYALAVLAGGLVWAQAKHTVQAFGRGEIDLAGAPRFEPPHPPDLEALGVVDHERVHARLIPAWSIAVGRATTPARRRYADRMFEALAAEVEVDPNVAELLAATHRALSEDPIGNARRIDYLLWAYNDYLDRHRMPWRVE